MRRCVRGLGARAKLLVMGLYVPAGIRRRELEELFGRTAAAFGQPVPPARGISVRTRLDDFARATRDWAEAALATGEDLDGIGGRLYRSARHLGRVYRARLGIGSQAQAFAAARAIYRGLGIDLNGDPRTGDVTVRRCMFSACYAPRVCGVISALDRGLFAGLSGGGELAFCQRITEGHAQCRARFHAAGQSAEATRRTVPPAIPRAIVVGSGAGGAAVARELQGTYQVTILEAGTPFRPFALPFRWMERLRNSGLLLDARAIGLAFPPMKVRKAADGMLVVSGRGTGGTTTLSTGNAMRFDGELAKLGIRLDEEFEQLGREVPQSIAHSTTWTPATRRLYAACEELGLSPWPTPKMIDFGRCRRCGRCVLGCPNGAKWDSRRFVDEAVGRGAVLETGWRVRRVVIRDGRAVGVVARRGLRTVFRPADLVVVAAGGLGTPAILERSGIPCEPRLFVDPVLTVAAPWPSGVPGGGQRGGQRREIPMPFVVQRPGCIVSPYFDHVSWLFDRRWRRPADQVLGLMIKLADTEHGSVSAKGRPIGRERIRKALTEADRRTLAEAVELCTLIFEKLGVDRRTVFLGTLNAGHPGGTLPLTAADAETLHPARLPPNLYVADASLLPASLGAPPILTIMAVAMRIGRLCAGRRRAEVVPSIYKQAGAPVYTDAEREIRGASRPAAIVEVMNPI